MGVAPAFGYTQNTGIDNAKLLNYQCVVERRNDPYAVDTVNPTKFRRTVEYLTVVSECASSSLDPNTNTDFDTFRSSVETRDTETAAYVDIGAASAIDFSPQCAAVWRWSECQIEMVDTGVARVMATLTAESTWAADT